MKNSYNEDFMREEYTKEDICNIRKNPYAKNITATDRLKVFLTAFIKENNWTKQETKEKVAAILS